jgi:NOL1/NOP2/fmu family ribosome biogenesis protein
MLAGCAVWVCCSDSGSNFAVRNVENVTRIELSDRDNHIVLSKTGDNEWLVSSFKANMQNILNLKTILSDVEVRYPLPKIYNSTYSNKKIVDEGIRIKVFEGKEIVKSYYLFITSEENAEVIGLTDEKQKPYVLELPGRDIDFNDYIVTESVFWENNVLFSYNAGQIKYLKIENNEIPNSSFSIEITDSISLFDADGKKCPFNKFKMDAYLSYFNNISFENNLNIPDDEKQKISSTEPLYIMTIIGVADSLTCFVKPISDNGTDDYGNQLVYNRDFFYLIVPQKNLFAKAAWLKFDILLEEISYFSQK